MSSENNDEARVVFFPDDALLAQFLERTGCGDTAQHGEGRDASFYLEKCKWNLEDAVRLYWEHQDSRAQTSSPETSLSSDEPLLSQFLKLTGIQDPAIARSYLEMSGGDLGTAVDLYLQTQVDLFPFNTKVTLTNLPEDHPSYQFNGMDGRIARAPRGKESLSSEERFVLVSCTKNGTQTINNTISVPLQYLKESVQRRFLPDSLVQIHPNLVARNPGGPCMAVLKTMKGVVMGYKDDIRLVEFSFELPGDKHAKQLLQLHADDLEIADDREQNKLEASSSTKESVTAENVALQIGSPVLINGVPQDHSLFCKNGCEGKVVEAPSKESTISEECRFVEMGEFADMQRIDDKIHKVPCEYLKRSERRFPLGSKVVIVPTEVGTRGPLDSVLLFLGEVLGYNGEGVRVVEFKVENVGRETTSQLHAVPVDKLCLTNEVDKDAIADCSCCVPFPVGSCVTFNFHPDIKFPKGMVLKIPPGFESEARLIQFSFVPGQPCIQAVPLPYLKAADSPKPSSKDLQISEVPEVKELFPVGSRAVITDLPEEHPSSSENGFEGKVVQAPKDETASDHVRFLELGEFNSEFKRVNVKTHKVPIQHLRTSTKPLPVGSKVVFTPEELEKSGSISTLLSNAVGEVLGYADDVLRLVEFDIHVCGLSKKQRVVVPLERLCLANDAQLETIYKAKNSDTPLPVGSKVILKQAPGLKEREGVVAQIPLGYEDLSRVVCFKLANGEPKFETIALPHLCPVTANQTPMQQQESGKLVDQPSTPSLSALQPGLPTPEAAMAMWEEMAILDPEDLRREAHRVLAQSREEWEANLGGIKLQEEQYQMFRKLWTTVEEDPIKIQSIIDGPNPQEGLLGLLMPTLGDKASATYHKYPRTVAKPTRKEAVEEVYDHEDQRIEEFFVAVENWTVPDVAAFLKEDPRRVHRRQNDRKRMMALHLAASRDRTPIVELLLQYKSDPYAEDADCCTPLHLAAAFGCVSSGRALIKAGVDPNVLRTNGQEKDVNLKTPLETAVYDEHVDFARMLLETGLLPQQSLDDALFYTTMSWNVPCARLLLEHDANVNARLPDSTIPLFHFVCGRGQAAFAELFLKFGVDLTIKDGPLTALDMAISSERHEIVNLIQKSPQFSSEMENQLFQKYKKQNATADSSCHGCSDPSKVKQQYYICLSCQKGAGETHVYCSQCVFDNRQQANRICCNHVLMPKVDTDPKQSIEEEKRRAMSKRGSLEKLQNNRCQRWLRAKVSSYDSFGLHKIIQQLSLPGTDTKAIISLILTEIPALVDIAYDGQRIACASTEELIEASSISWAKKFGSESTALNAMSNALARVSPPGSREYIQDLSYWIRAQYARPRDGLPSWMALLGASQDTNQVIASEFLSLMCFSKMANETSLVQNVALLQPYVETDRRKRHVPVLARTSVDDLEVALLPSFNLFLMDRMPEHCECDWGNANPLPSDAPTLKLFISHRWRNPDHPDKDGVDWKALKKCLLTLTRRAIMVFTLLMYMGFDREAIGEDPFSDPETEPEGIILSRRMGIFSFGVNGDGDFEETAMLSATYEPILAKLLQIFCYWHAQDDSQTPISDEGLPRLCQRVLDCVFLWIDFVSLPQDKTRKRTPEQYAWFKDSLKHMGAIQRSMLSVLVEPTDEYFGRAWCVAEYINTNQEFSKVNVTPEPNESDPMLPRDRPDVEAWLRAMLGPDSATAEELIQFMELSIVNGSDGDDVCAIIWSRVSPYLQNKAIAGLTATTNKMVQMMPHEIFPQTTAKHWTVSRGRAKLVTEYLEAMRTKEISDYYEGWLPWKKRLSSDDIKKEERILSIALLADSCVTSRPHKLLSTLQSMATFLKTKISENQPVEITLYSGYTIDSIREMKRQRKALVVALPTSVFASQADFVVLHPHQMRYGMSLYQPAGQEKD